ncbi:MAG: glucosidase [Gammaproteobacteria bacterium]|nr:MAG: glucosidase [Gammaproteobacteria bacterium]
MARTTSLTRTAEHRRLKAHRERRANWKNWGPYLAERAWGTVRKDYSVNGDAWHHFPHDHARSRSYRWNEDGLAGFCDRRQLLCLSLALWNGADPFLKERLFGLAGPEGNHGEDVKELYWYEDSTPTHSYARLRYRYPHAAFPYEDLVAENGRRGRQEREYELEDTGVFADGRWFDVSVHYAKAAEDDILIVIDVENAAAESAAITLVPQLWFRNTWSWGYPQGPQDVSGEVPAIRLANDHAVAEHSVLGRYHLYWQGEARPMFTDNETNHERLFHQPNPSPHVKDAFHRHVVNGEDCLNPDMHGSKFGVCFQARIAAGAATRFRLRLSAREHALPFRRFEPLLRKRREEADAWFDAIANDRLGAAERRIQRQALAGMLWSKQLYYYNVHQWLDGDPNHPVKRCNTRNRNWENLHSFDILSMPDKWEYPWFAVWDTAFHCLPLAMVDADFARRQLQLFTREWYQHPNGQIPAYEWNFGDVNPPVHAWAALEVYYIEQSKSGRGDRAWLEGLFHKLLLNFNWWVNRKDLTGNSLFEGGFLGLDNISVFDRSAGMAPGSSLSQADGTAWMGFFSARMLAIALELARENPVYEDVAHKFLEHYLRIAAAINGRGHHQGLWDEEDGFYYDVIEKHDGHIEFIKVRSLVGLMPLIAATLIDNEVYTRFPTFVRRLEWLTDNRIHLTDALDTDHQGEDSARHLLSFVSGDRLRRVLTRLLDENEFLSPHGIRSLSKHHAEHPVTYRDKHVTNTLTYEPGESETDLFGGNSNWRGPVWFPINYLLIEALRRYHAYLGDDFRIECPTGSGVMMTLDEVANDVSARLVSLFTANDDAPAPFATGSEMLETARREQGLLQFHEFFNGDTGEGLGASHQTGWTGLVAVLLEQLGRQRAAS